MKILTTKVCYKVPGWGYCNLDSGKNPFIVNKEHCRFCVKTHSGYTCVLHNMQLAMQDGHIIKTHSCAKTSQFTTGEVELEEDEPLNIKPAQIAKASIKAFVSDYKRLRSQGFTEELALQLTQQSLIESK
jgi:hypothetical protein